MYQVVLLIEKQKKNMFNDYLLVIAMIKGLTFSSQILCNRLSHKTANNNLNLKFLIQQVTETGAFYIPFPYKNLPEAYFLLSV